MALANRLLAVRVDVNTRTTEAGYAKAPIHTGFWFIFPDPETAYEVLRAFGWTVKRSNQRKKKP